MRYEKLSKYEKIIADWKKESSCIIEYAVMEVISKAKSHQLDNLRMSFPDQVKAYEFYMGDSKWWVNIQLKLKGRRLG